MCCVININYAKYIKNILQEKSALLSCLQNNFKLVRTINFQLPSGCDSWNIFWSKTNTWTTPVRTNICPKCVKKNALTVSSLRCCVYEGTFDIYHKWRVNIKTWVQIWCVCCGLNRPRRLANCKLYSRLCSRHFPKKNFFAPKYSSVVNVLTICYGTISANVNDVLKPALQV